MKIRILVLLGLLVLPLAGHGAVEVAPVPEQPFVILRDMDENIGMDVERRAKAPYFEMQVKVRNVEKAPIEVTSVNISAVSAEGRKVTKAFPVKAVTLAPGEEKTLGGFILDDLSLSESIVYSVNSSVEYKIDGKAASQAVSFKTHQTIGL